MDMMSSRRLGSALNVRLGQRMGHNDRAALGAMALLGALAVAGCAPATPTGSTGGGAGGTNGGTGGSGGVPAGTGGASLGSGGSSGTGGTSGVAGGAGGSGGRLLGTGGAGTGGTGTGGRGNGGSGTGTGGGSTGIGGTAGSGTATGNGGGGGWFLGGTSRCPGSAFAVCEDFEATAVGANPTTNWTVPTTNYGTGSFAVASDDAARGAHSLKITIPTGAGSTERYLQRTNLGTLANAHFGRLFFKIQNPTTTQFVHWDMILGAGLYNGSARRIRWGVTGTGIGAASANWAWIYNIEQGDTGIESRVTHPVLDQWMCLEWQWVGGTTQSTRFYFQGNEVLGFHVDGTFPNGNPPQIPIFTTLNFGLAKYQTTNAPLVFWIDEIALDTQRITCAN